jgi:hypothetical protein
MVNKKKIPKKTVKSKKKEVSKKNKVIKIKKSGLILNPKTKRYVKATGKIGKQLLAKQVVQRGGGKYLSRYLTSWDLGEDGASNIYAYIITRDNGEELTDDFLNSIMNGTDDKKILTDTNEEQVFDGYKVRRLQLVKGNPQPDQGGYWGKVVYTESVQYSQCFTCNPERTVFVDDSTQLNLGGDVLFFQFHGEISLKTILGENNNYFGDGDGKGVIFPCAKILISTGSDNMPTYSAMPIAEPYLGEGDKPNKGKCIPFAKIEEEEDDDKKTVFTDFPTVSFNLNEGKKLVFLSKKKLDTPKKVLNDCKLTHDCYEHIYTELQTLKTAEDNLNLTEIIATELEPDSVEGDLLVRQTALLERVEEIKELMTKCWNAYNAGEIPDSTPATPAANAAVTPAVGATGSETPKIPQNFPLVAIDQSNEMSKDSHDSGHYYHLPKTMKLYDNGDDGVVVAFDGHPHYSLGDSNTGNAGNAGNAGNTGGQELMTYLETNFNLILDDKITDGEIANDTIGVGVKLMKFIDDILLGKVFTKFISNDDTHLNELDKIFTISMHEFKDFLEGGTLEPKIIIRFMLISILSIYYRDKNAFPTGDTPYQSIAIGNFKTQFLEAFGVTVDALKEKVDSRDDETRALLDKIKSIDNKRDFASVILEEAEVDLSGGGDIYGILCKFIPLKNILAAFLSLAKVTANGAPFGGSTDGSAEGSTEGSGTHVGFIWDGRSGVMPQLPCTFLTLYCLDESKAPKIGVDVDELQKLLRIQESSISNVFILGKYPESIAQSAYACVFYPVRLDVLLEKTEGAITYNLSKTLIGEYDNK